MKVMDCGARLRTVEQLTDQKSLETYALEDPDRRVRLAAIGKLIDRSLLTDIAEIESAYPGIRDAAKHRLSELL